MRHVIIALLAVYAVIPAYSQRILVDYAPGAKDQVIADLKAKGFVVDIEYQSIAALAIRKDGAPVIPTDRRPATAAEVSAVAAVPSVKKAEVDGFLELHSCAGDSIEGDEFIPYGINNVEAHDPAFWDATRQTNVANTMMFCVVDEGLDKTHPDLQGNIMVGADGPDAWDNPSGPHGTHVTGTMLAVGGQTCTGNCGTANGLVGVLRNGATIYSNNVFGPNGGGSWSTVINAWDKCYTYYNTWKGATNRKMVINNSLGGSIFGASSSVAENMINTMYNSGNVLIFASSGNSGSRQASYPAAFANVISVSAVDINNVIASFSTYHSSVELTAPGVSVVSTIPTTSNNYNLAGGSSLEITTGMPVNWDDKPYALPLEGSGTDTVVNTTLVDCGLGDYSCTAAAGKVCLIQRGSITFCEKMLNCQRGGGVAAVIYNNDAGSCSPLNAVTLVNSGSACANVARLPTVGITRGQGEALKNSAGGAISVTVKGSIPGAGPYDSWDGTSMSCPHVTAVSALVWAQMPACSNARIREALQKSALDLGATGRDVYYGFGLVKAKQAYNWLVANGCPASAPAPVPVSGANSNKKG